MSLQKWQIFINCIISNAKCITTILLDKKSSVFQFGVNFNVESKVLPEKNLFLVVHARPNFAKHLRKS